MENPRPPPAFTWWPVQDAVDELGSEGSEALAPVRRTGDAGFDLKSLRRVVVPGMRRGVPGKLVVRTGIGMSFAVKGARAYYGKIASRSGLACKLDSHGQPRGLVAFHGTVDPSYRGEIMVLMSNFGPDDFTLERGDRFAQIIPICYSRLPVCRGSPEEAEGPDRGGGFGSTGLSGDLVPAPDQRQMSG